VTGAYYAVSRDDALPLKGGLAPVLGWTAAEKPSPKLEVDAARGVLACNEDLNGQERQRVRDRLPEREATLVIDLCEHGARPWHRRWNAATVTELMQRDYVSRWMGNWFWPDNALKYWFTAFDRSDLMAQTLEDNLYDAPTTGIELTFADLNRQRPYLIINSTNASQQIAPGDPLYEPFSFGSVFTFTDDDFRDRLRSDIRAFSVARAVMASAAFPLVFANATLGDFRAAALKTCRENPRDPLCQQQRYLHVFDGGNSDNLGLKSVKRAIFELAVDDKLDEYQHVVVLLVDAFTQPGGASREVADPRGAVGRLLDTNLLEAVDALLQTNRAKHAGEFRSHQLTWRDGDCERETRNLPVALCDRLNDKFRVSGRIDLRGRMTFYHFGFDDVEPKDPALKARLDGIPTSFKISPEAAADIDRAIALVLTPDNACLALIRDLVQGDPIASRARQDCDAEDVLPQAPKK
jgi:hypothetical protein